MPPQKIVFAREVRRRFVVLVIAMLAVLVAGLPAIGAPSQGDRDPEPRKHRRSYDDLTVTSERAKASGQRQELKTARRANSTTFVEADGSTTEVLTARPTRVRKGEAFVNQDSRLSRRERRPETCGYYRAGRGL